MIEPILVSPLTLGTTDGKAGFYCIQTLNFQMSMQASANRTWRSAWIGNYTITARVMEFINSRELLQLLTPHASQMLTSRNVVPYYELPVYRTGNLPAINGIGDGEMLGRRSKTGGIMARGSISSCPCLKHSIEWYSR